MNILFIGDIVGNPGRRAVKEILPGLKKEKEIHFCIANAENAAGGSGITHVIAQELYGIGIDGLTLGNHTWSKKEITNFIDSDSKIVRPANYADGVPGRGATFIENSHGKIGIANLIGRVFMEPVNCPFVTADNVVAELKKSTKVVIIDMHAEATSEKAALAWYLDGRVAAVIGTHTHVQTSDERILECGTGFITDVGMCGPADGILGVDREIIIHKLKTGLPARFELANGPIRLDAVFMEVDDKKGIVKNIERISKRLN